MLLNNLSELHGKDLTVMCCSISGVCQVSFTRVVGAYLLIHRCGFSSEHFQRSPFLRIADRKKRPVDCSNL